ncbi:uncharacterized protein RJT21DRAFT_120004 [Scheffersomyces amazonensis]|uniref:uncharacterized protein n=1 Tax=Scheffersomyces amazonensis TaxID=1078765 RepID=UPI00315D7B5F
MSLGLLVYAAAKPIFKIYFIIAVGFYLAKKNILTVATTRDIADAIVTAIMPCLIFDNIVTNLKSSDIKNLGIIFFTGTLLFIIGLAMAYVTHIVTRSPKRWLGGLLSVGLFPNISDLPIAYLQTLSKGDVIFTADEGNLGVAYVCIFLASQVFYQFSLGLYRLIEWDFREELLGDSIIDEEKKLEDSSEEDSHFPIHTATNPNNLSLPIPLDPSRPAISIDDEISITSSSDSQAILESASTTNDSEQPNQHLSPLPSQSQAQSQLQSQSQSQPQRHPSILKKVSSNRDSHHIHHSHIDPEQEEINQHDEFLRVRSLKKVTSNPRSITSGGSSRRNSISSVNYNTLQMIPSRTTELRKLRSQDIHDVINEYSEFENLRHNEIKKTITAMSDVGAISVKDSRKSTIIDDSQDEVPLTRGQKFKKQLIQTAKNFLAPNSVSLIVSTIIAMSPPLKALFVTTDNFTIHPAPDGQPPLSFIIDLTSYIGAASVPLGLLLLGATISRLQVKRMPPGFWKTAVMITAARLIIIPIFGVGLTTGFHKGGWYGDDKLIRFVSVLEFGLPNATALVYFTAFYTDPTSEDFLQMDCLAVCLICQYSILFITLPFLVTFTLSVSLGF